MYRDRQVTLVIPALDEEESIGTLLGRVDRTLVDRIIVVDNGSVDRTADRALQGGAVVLREDRRGYGSACLMAIREGPATDCVVFMDGDGSDDPQEIELLLRAMHALDADLVVGSRVLGRSEKGALTISQRFGNALACRLVQLFWGVKYTDLGPFRAIRQRALERLDMSDPDYGWTVEMQVKAAQRGLRIAEVPVHRRTRKGGRSKVSGTIVGSFRAARRILAYIIQAKLSELMRSGTVGRTKPS